MDWYKEAKEKLDAKGGSFDKYGSAMKKAVGEKLLDFCRQDGEFAQAVAQGGSFADCMKAVAGKVKGNCISDLDAYQAAVSFYFPTAVIRCTMTIDPTGTVDEPAPEEKTEGKPGGIRLSLTDFL